MEMVLQISRASFASVRFERRTYESLLKPDIAKGTSYVGMKISVATLKTLA